MFTVSLNSLRRSKAMILLSVLLALTLVAPLGAKVKVKKKKVVDDKPSILANLDYSKIVWPQPPDIARVKYTAFFAGEKIVPTTAKPKQGWMDRVAGSELASDKAKPRFTLVEPYGLAVDSKGLLYVADTKVGAIFIFNPETRDVEMIKNGQNAHFLRVTGLAIDDADNLYVADNGLHHVLVFNSRREVEATISEGLVRPGGVAVDTENRLLYVSDVEVDQVLVYDLDSHRLLRKMGKTGEKHSLTSPGDFSSPAGLAVDKAGVLYVCDTLNNRIELFDAEGQYISAYGKNGDGPGDFARPKGIALDSDGHVWVADGALNRLTVLDKDWRLLTYIGVSGNLPGQFAGLTGIAIDKQNRVFSSEIYPGRVQQFRYITDAEAEAEKLRRQAELDKKSNRTSQPAVAPKPALEPKPGPGPKPTEAEAEKDKAH